MAWPGDVSVAFEAPSWTIGRFHPQRSGSKTFCDSQWFFWSVCAVLLLDLQHEACPYHHGCLPTSRLHGSKETLEHSSTKATNCLTLVNSYLSTGKKLRTKWALQVSNEKEGLSAWAYKPTFLAQKLWLIWIHESMPWASEVSAFCWHNSQRCVEVLSSFAWATEAGFWWNSPSDFALISTREARPVRPSVTSQSQSFLARSVCWDSQLVGISSLCVKRSLFKGIWHAACWVSDFVSSWKVWSLAIRNGASLRYRTQRYEFSSTACLE